MFLLFSVSSSFIPFHMGTELQWFPLSNLEYLCFFLILFIVSLCDLYFTPIFHLLVHCILCNSSQYNCFIYMIKTVCIFHSMHWILNNLIHGSSTPITASDTNARSKDPYKHPTSENQGLDLQIKDNDHLTLQFMIMYVF